MAVIKTRVEPIDKDINLLLSGDLSPAARSRALAEFAGEAISAAERKNTQALGRPTRRTIYVDGREGASLSQVRPDGEIVAEFELFNDVLSWVSDQLERHSPVKSGRYKRSHGLFADGAQIDAQQTRIPDAQEYVFINIVPYARKIESGASSQAPDGVYQAVATLARRRFGNLARISFTYRTAIAGAIVTGRKGNRSSLRNPAITITTRG